ncbi:hypothetical protein NPIL_475401 [Nephila pilipes]|uniref:Uncharacterized protein n=1 Tax=Nephila pilipes TaxID=299642 RepID=A0A8X6QEP8_NEPPI|nr:hypothetical protein NPIL_475401 [Nephila pilipes]
MAARMASTEVSECTLKFISDLQKEGKHPFLVWVMKVGLIASTYVCPKCGDDMRLCESLSVMDGFECRCKKRGENAHYVRELHFAEERRNTEVYDEKTGMKIDVPLKCCRLQKFAVPIIFPNCPKYISKSSNPA